MREVPRPSPDPPAPRSRSDSLVRMLELEQVCKMRRIQQDQSHGSSTSTSNSPRVTFPSITANPPAPRSRRASEYPPLSHQTQIMKAVRRSAALPSLSLSIAPSPTRVMTMRSEGSVDKISSTKEESFKTVTFSEPENDDDDDDDDDALSDDSSICQSPSWEQYGQKKKKKPKKVTDQNSAKAKQDTIFKRRSNRLVKPARADASTVKPLTTSDRSMSTPNLLMVQSGKMSSPFSPADGKVALDKHQALRDESGPTTKDKSRGRGFLSGFRLQHGNVAAVQKLVETRKGGEKSTGEKGTLRSIQYETLPAQQPNGNRPGNDQSVPESRKPSSIRSALSNSDQSLSSQEKRGSGLRTPTGSGLSRSQSLLSTTLNKLRGPSYLYYQPARDGSANTARQPANSQDMGTMPGSLADGANDMAFKLPSGRKQGDIEHPQQPLDSAFPPKHRRSNTEPGPDIAPRARQLRPRKIEVRAPGTEQGDNLSTAPRDRRAQIESPHASTRDTVMALVTAQEKRSHTARTAQQTRSAMVDGEQVSDVTKTRTSGGIGPDGRTTNSRIHTGDIRRSVSSHADAMNISNGQWLNRRGGKGGLSFGQDDTSDVRNGHIPEDDQVSVGTHASTIRPVSNCYDNGLMEDIIQGNLPSTGCSEPHVHDAVPAGLEIQQETLAARSVDDLITFEKDVPDTLPQPLQPRREADYFESFQDSYLPPVLDLYSPNDGQPLSPRFAFVEELDEDIDHNTLYDPPRTSHGKDKPVGIGRATEVALTADAQRKDTGRSVNEPKFKNSPAISAQYSDSDVSAFERLGLSSKEARILVGAEASSDSMSHSQHTNPSRTTSERSSSSISGDSPPSPSSATTPNSSRPQSRKGMLVSQPESSHTTPLGSVSAIGNNVVRANFWGMSDEQAEETAPRESRTEADANDGNQGEATSTPYVEQQTTFTSTKTRGSATPSLVATPTSVSFADVRRDSNDEDEHGVGRHPARPLPPRAQSALDLHSATPSLARSTRPQQLQLKSSEGSSSVSLPCSPPPDLTGDVMPRKSALKMSRQNSSNGPELSKPMSMGAAYLQEARKAVPVASTSTSRAMRPHFSPKHSSGSIQSVVSAGNRAEPLAKMLVECCNCHFFHDMPSRVYECMAKPDSVVEDKSLGVSAAITTMVRCPWCAHGMTTQCCSGYAAVVYLKEKLHGK